MKAFSAISVPVLAFLVLISTTNFMVGMHFCMGDVQSISLFTKADGCEKEQNLPPCHQHMRAPCCADETVIHKGDDLKTSIAQSQIVASATFTIEQPLVLISQIIPAAPQSRIQYYNYDPPLRSCDLTVAHQVFLI